MLDTNHQLYKLAESVNWTFLEEKIISILGRDQGSHWRLVTGCIYLKSFYDLSSIELAARWPQCQHLRYFCGGELNNNGPMPFPISQTELEKLSCELIGDGYDAMIKALQAQAVEDAQHRVSSAVH